MIYGYARAAADNYEESFAKQRKELTEAGAKRVYCESCSGLQVDRPVPKDLLRSMKAGDTLLITSMDRLSRDVQQVIYFATVFKEKGVKIKFLNGQTDFEKICKIEEALKK